MTTSKSSIAFLDGVAEKREVTRRTVTRTIRLDTDIDSRLVEKADREKLSVATVANIALLGYLDWTQYRDDIRHSTVSMSLLEKMMDMVTMEQAEALGRWYGTNTLIEMSNFWFGSVRFTSTIATLVLMSKYSGLFSLVHEYNNGKHYLSLHHPGGAKWSKFYEAFLTAGLEKAHALQFDISASPSMVEVTVVEPLTKKGPG